MLCDVAESKHAACANHLSAVIYRVLRQCNSKKKNHKFFMAFIA